MISLRAVNKSFNKGKTYQVRDLSLDIPSGELFVLLGSSGCGKTTVLRMINALIKPTTGNIFIDNKDITEQDPITLRRSMGYAFQGVGLFPHLTVSDNISCVLKLLKSPADVCQQRAYELLSLVNLDPKQFADRFPNELSGGQQQRVGVARALATDPRYLLMDEPFGALDAITRDKLQDELLQLKQRLKKTIIFITHDIFEALKLGDKIAVMDKGQLQQVGTPQHLLQNPANEFVENLLAAPSKQCDLLGSHY